LSQGLNTLWKTGRPGYWRVVVKNFAVRVERGIRSGDTCFSVETEGWASTERACSKSDGRIFNRIQKFKV